MIFIKSSSSKSIKFKFGLLVFLLLFLIFVISAGISIYQNIQTQEKNLIEKARSFAKLSATPIGSAYTLYYHSGYLKFSQLISEILALNSDIDSVEIISPNGEILFNSRLQDKVKIEDRLILERVRLNLSSEVPISRQDYKPSQIIEPYFEDFGAHPFSIRYFISYDSISKNILVAVVTITAVSALIFTLAMLTILFVVNQTIINPLEKVVLGTEKVSSGHFDHPIKVDTSDEIEDLAHAVNNMAKTLKKQIEDLKKLDELKDEFVMIASHNLRTPLAVLKGYLSSAKSQNVHFKGQEAVEKKVEELDILVEQLIDIVAIESKTVYLGKEKFDLLKLIEEILDEHQDRVKAKKLELNWQIAQDEKFKIVSDRQKIKRAIEAVIDNAIKFNKINGKIVIELLKDDDYFLIKVSDTGIGIAESEKKIFGKFYRGTSMLEYDYPGSGLGLYVAKLIIEFLGGKIWYWSKHKMGTTFFIKLATS